MSFDTGPVFELFDVFADADQQMGWRTQKMRADGLHALLKAAILGMHWTIDDASAVSARFGVANGKLRFRIDEKAYAEALRYGNKSACASIEALLNREPWVWPSDIDPLGPDDGRVGLDFDVWYKEAWWTVTSITPSKITICLYPDGSPVRRKTFTRQALKALRVAA